MEPDEFVLGICAVFAHIDTGTTVRAFYYMFNIIVTRYALMSCWTSRFNLSIHHTIPHLAPVLIGSLSSKYPFSVNILNIKKLR